MYDGEEGTLETWGDYSSYLSSDDLSEFFWSYTCTIFYFCKLMLVFYQSFSVSIWFGLLLQLLLLFF